MKFHLSRLGSFGGGITTDRDGYVTCSPRKVAAIRRALARGETPPAWADVGVNKEVADAEIGISEWRNQ